MLPALLVLVPLAAALLLLFIGNNDVRKYLVSAAALGTGVLSVAVAVNFLNQPTVLTGTTWLQDAVLAVDVLTAGAVFYYTVKFRRYGIALLELVQVALVLGFEFGGVHVASPAPFLIDNFAVVMLLIAGIVGSLIGVFSLGYMEEFQCEHPEVQDRRQFFFFVVFMFLGAMCGLVMSNSLVYMYTCWEITSLCSFLLIGYTQSAEAVENSFKALWMNLLGGLAFAVAIVWMGTAFRTVELTEFLSLQQGGVVNLLVALLVFCGFTKCAMMPFSGWLLGAMVAPTPTSALLHSSTMVKAGVFLIIKLCPMLGANAVGFMTMMVGGVTFVFASFAAISQSDGKRVLAYSTISNLGLIVCCAGVGSYAAAWTAVMLVVFHAVAKSLCFLSVGTAEQQLGSRNVEVFDGLMNRLPRLGQCMIVGICGMFLAPFGMLISKWAAMKSFVDAGHPLLVLIVVFGSASTFFYWCKWLGKMCISVPATRQEEGVHWNQWLALESLTMLVVAVCLGFHWISKFAVIPYFSGIYGQTPDVISDGNLLIMSVLMLILVLLPFGFGRGRQGRQVATQLSGVGCDGGMSFSGVAGAEVSVTLRNWYLEEWFGEGRMKLWGFSLSIACMAVIFSLLCGGVFHV